MAFFTLSSPTADCEENLPSAWLTALGLLLLVASVINEVVSVNATESLAVISAGAEFLSIYLVI